MGPAHLSRCTFADSHHDPIPSTYLQSSQATYIAAIRMCHVVPDHCVHHCLCLECSADFVTWSTVDYPSRPTQLSSSLDAITINNPFLCVSEVLCVCVPADPGCPSVLTLKHGAFVTFVYFLYWSWTWRTLSPLCMSSQFLTDIYLQEENII